MTTSPNIQPTLTPQAVSMPETITPKVDLTPTPPISVGRSRFPRKFSPKMMFGILAGVVLVSGILAALFLSQNSSDIRQQASGYSDCGNIKDGQSTCTGSRQPAKCVNGALVPQTLCSISGVCEGGVCINSDTVFPACKSSAGLFGGNVNNSSACMNNGAKYYECNSGFVNKDNGCVATTDTCGTAPVVNNQLANSTACQKNGATVYKCDAGFTLTNGACVAIAGTAPACGTSNGLFQSQVANSTACSNNGATYYKCNSGYANQNNGCVSSVNTCGTGSGLFTTQVANSSSCNNNGNTFYKCNTGYVNQNNACVSSAPTPTPKYKVVTLSDGGALCQQCTATESCSLDASTCVAQADAKNALINNSNCYTPPDCGKYVVKKTCSSGEYTSQTACQASIQPSKYRMVGSGNSASCSPCGPSEFCGYTKDSCNAALEAQKTRNCYSGSDCNIITTVPASQSCPTGSGKYPSVTACLSAQPPKEVALAETYRIVGTAPNESCAKCAVASQCGYTAGSCQAQAQEDNTNATTTPHVWCYNVGNSCTIARQRDNRCNPGETTDQEACKKALNAGSGSVSSSGGLKDGGISGGT